jgi:hypothetical protein
MTALATRWMFPALLVAACSSSPSTAPADAGAAVDAPVGDARVIDAPGVDAPGVDAPAAPTALRWEELVVAGSGPYGRWGYMVADVGDGTAYVYGGTTLTAAGAGTVANDLWLFDGRGDATTFVRVITSGAVPPRYCGCLGWSPEARALIMIGGRNPNEAPAETWALDAASGQWSRLAVATTPGGVIGCQLGWSRARGALYLFGGGGAAVGFSNRTWRYDPAAPAWVPLDATGPRARYDDAFVPLPDGRRFVMVAGARTAQAGAGFYNDVWTYDAMDDAWQQVTSSGAAPDGRRSPWISVDPDGHGIVMAMGSTGIQAGEVLDDLWRLDLRSGAWSRVEAAGPPARGFMTALPGRPGVRGYLMGGFDNQRPVRDLWRLLEE